MITTQHVIIMADWVIDKGQLVSFGVNIATREEFPLLNTIIDQKET